MPHHVVLLLFYYLFSFRILLVLPVLFAFQTPTYLHCLLLFVLLLLFIILFAAPILKRNHFCCYSVICDCLIKDTFYWGQIKKMAEHRSLLYLAVILINFCLAQRLCNIFVWFFNSRKRRVRLNWIAYKYERYIYVCLICQS